MEQHFKDQIDHILDNFDFGKVRGVMLLLDWTWGNEASPPSIERLRDCARRMLTRLARHEREDVTASTGGFEAQKFGGRHLCLGFVAEEMDGADVVGDEGPPTTSPAEDDLKALVENWPDRMGYPSLFVRKLRDLPLPDEQIAGVLKAVDETCHECWDAEAGCHCWNDT